MNRNRNWLRYVATAACGAAFCATANADEVELTNGDRINGAIASLDAETLVLRSENFGEVKIPRDKVRLIGLGDEGIPEQQVVQASAPQSAAATAPGGLNLQELMKNPMVQQQMSGLLGEAMGGRSTDDVQSDLQRSRRDLQELADDLGGIEGEAIGNYVKIFDLLGGGLNAAGQTAPTPRQPEEQVAPPSGTPPQVKPEK